MRSFAVLAAMCLFAVPCFCQTTPNAPDSNAAATTTPPATPAFAEGKQDSLYSFLISRYDILLGFGLGLVGTVLIDGMKRRRKAREYRKGVNAELHQVLAVLNCYINNFDAKITIEKLKTYLALSREFSLSKAACPLIDDISVYEKMENSTDQVLNQFVEFHNVQKHNREQTDSYQKIKLLNCLFITNNIESVSLLGKTECPLLLNIIRRLNILNAEISRLEFGFERSYDSSVSPENHGRLRKNYLDGCQFISDWSYETAKEIASFLRK